MAAVPPIGHTGSDGGVARGRFTTDDTERARRFLSRAYAELAIAVHGAPEDFRYGHESASTAEFGIVHSAYGGALSLEVDRFDDVVAVNSVRHGHLAFERSDFGDARATAGQAVLSPPTGRFTAVVDGAGLDVVVLSGAAVAGYAAATCGIDPDRMRMTGIVPVSTVAAEHWHATVEHIRGSVMSSPVVAVNPAVVASATRLLISAMLSCFPNTALPAPDDPVARGRIHPRTATRVLDYINAHADSAIGPADVAAVAGLPTRGTDGALRRGRDTTLARELWLARLRGAHRDLLAGDPAQHTAGGVAARWGFTGAATFRVAYGAFTGESPEDTLRR